MALLRFFFLLITWPLALVSKLLAPKGSIVEVNFTFTNTICYIKTHANSRYLLDDLLTSAFISFIGKYLFICDDRQTEPMMRFLAQNLIHTKFVPGRFVTGAYTTAFDTLSIDEQKVVRDLFIMGTPPLQYSEENPTGNKMTEYSIKISDQLFIYFQMSTGPDVILLPITVGLLYEYVMEKISTEKNKERLNLLAIKLLRLYKDVDCRSQEALPLPHLILKEALVCK